MAGASSRPPWVPVGRAFGAVAEVVYEDRTDLDPDNPPDLEPCPVAVNG